MNALHPSTVALALALLAACRPEVGLSSYASDLDCAGCSDTAAASTTAPASDALDVIAARATCDALGDDFLFELFVNDPAASVEWVTITLIDTFHNEQVDQFPLYAPVDEHTWELAVFDEQTPVNCTSWLEAEWSVHLRDGTDFTELRQVGQSY